MVMDPQSARWPILCELQPSQGPAGKHRAGVSRDQIWRPAKTTRLTATEPQTQTRPRRQSSASHPHLSFLSACHPPAGLLDDSSCCSIQRPPRGLILALIGGYRTRTTRTRAWAPMALRARTRALAKMQTRTRYRTRTRVQSICTQTRTRPRRSRLWSQMTDLRTMWTLKLSWRSNAR